MFLVCIRLLQDNETVAGWVAGGSDTQNGQPDAQVLNACDSLGLPQSVFEGRKFGGECPTKTKHGYQCCLMRGHLHVLLLLS